MIVTLDPAVARRHGGVDLLFISMPDDVVLKGNDPLDGRHVRRIG
jgi:hypothetical protein